jgi:eukaryotic-like serine/threonine-protein kinase
MKLGSYVIDRRLAPRRGRWRYVTRDFLKRPLLITAVDAHDTARVAELEAELKALSRLRHASIIRGRGFAEDSGYAFYVSDYIKGGVPLQSLAVTGRLMLPGSTALFGRVLEIVSYLHAKGITHGDLAPDNVVVYRKGRHAVPLMMGFGFSRVTSVTALETGQLTGELQFVSPEHADFLLGHTPGKTTYQAGPRDDVYAIGVNLYFLLTGEWPIPRSTAETWQGQLDFLRRVREHQVLQPFKVNPYAPLHLTDLALKMMDRAPSQRPPDAVAAYREYLTARALDRDDLDSMAIFLTHAASTTPSGLPRVSSRSRQAQAARPPPLFDPAWLERAVWVVALIAIVMWGLLTLLPSTLKPTRTPAVREASQTNPPYDYE